MKNLLIAFLLLSFSGFAQSTPTDSTIKSGLWSDPTIWNTGVIPSGAGKRVQISQFTVVRIDTNIVVDSVFVRPGSFLMWTDNKSLNNVIKENTLSNGYLPTKINQRNGNFSDVGVWGVSVPISTDDVLVNEYSFVRINQNVRVNKMVIRWNASFDVSHNKSLNGIKYQYYR